MVIWLPPSLFNCPRGWFMNDPLPIIHTVTTENRHPLFFVCCSIKVKLLILQNIIYEHGYLCYRVFTVRAGWVNRIGPLYINGREGQFWKWLKILRFYALNWYIRISTYSTKICIAYEWPPDSFLRVCKNFLTHDCLFSKVTWSNLIKTIRYYFLLSILRPTNKTLGVFCGELCRRYYTKIRDLC